jgi:hypothetical protein
MSKRPFLMDGDSAGEVIDRWKRRGILCELNADGTGIKVKNCSWPVDGEPVPDVSPEALEELGEHYRA